MNALFEYSLLKYNHSVSLGEGLNVGILFHFPEEKQLLFRFPNQESRIKAAFPSVDYAFLQQRLTDFNSSSQLIKLEENHQTLENIIQSYFQIWETSPLQFDLCCTALKTCAETTDEANLYEEFYFRKFLKKNAIKKQSNEFNYFELNKKTSKDVFQYYKQLIEIKSPDVINKFKSIKVIRNEHSIFIPDAIWENGTTNVVKAITFDFKKEVQIIDEALLLHSKLNYLAHLAEDLNYRFDLLVGKPNDIKRLPEYKNAVEILNEIKAPKEIIEENEFQEYSEKTITEAKS